MDLNNDGINDILSGCYSQRGHKEMVGSFWVLWGTKEGFKTPVELTGTDGELLWAQSETNTDNICTRPFAVDWDADGDLDIVAGNFAGTFYLYTADSHGKYNPTATKLLDKDGNVLKTSGVHSDPFVVDWDADGDLDFVAASHDGKVVWAENVAGKTDKTPKLAAFKLILNSKGNPPASVSEEYRKAITEAYAYAESSEFDKAEATLTKAIEGNPKVADGYYHLACCIVRRAKSVDGEARAEQIKRALDTLDKAFANGWTNTNHMNKDTDMDLLRDNDRFKKLLKSVKPAVGPAGNTRIHVADVNGDGKLDILMGDSFYRGGGVRNDLTDKERGEYKELNTKVTEVNKSVSVITQKYYDAYFEALKEAKDDGKELSSEETRALFKKHYTDPANANEELKKLRKQSSELRKQLAKYKTPVERGGNIWLYVQK